VFLPPPPTKKKKEMRLNGVAMLFRTKELFIAQESARLPPKFTTLVTGHGKINAYLHRFKIIDNLECPCNKGEQSIDHIIYSCVRHEQERNRLKAAIYISEKWPVSKNKLATKYYKQFKAFTDSLVLNID
jgi:hypothetical protein